MNIEQDHEIVPAIQHWLAATSGVSIPLGISRKEARWRACELLAAVVDGTIAPDRVEMDDDFKDVLWASTEELDAKPLSQMTFEECDCFYRFVADLSVENDPFDERGEILHRVARVGWRSAPGGLEAALEARAAIWKHGDERRHREVCENADQLPGRVEALTSQQICDLPEIRETCARMVKLSSICPSVVAASVAAMEALIAKEGRRIGRLDDSENLKGVIALTSAMADRNLGRWDSANSGYARAESAFRRTADTSDLDRVKVDRLAIHLARGGNEHLAESVPALVQTLVIPRDKTKAQLILAQALIDLDRPHDASLILEGLRQDPGIGSEPAFQATLFSKLGVALSYEGKDAEAVAAFQSAGAILKRFFHPLQLADLTGAIGEHQTKLGRLREAMTLYLAARAEFQRMGHAKFVGYYSVLVAELMMLLGRNEDAEAELLAALPLIEKFDLREEAVAAVALLREAFVKRHTDVTTIRKLRDQIRKELL